MSRTIKPLVLLILDGWGYREDAPDNAISNAQTPVMDRIYGMAIDCGGSGRYLVKGSLIVHFQSQIKICESMPSFS